MLLLENNYCGFNYVHLRTVGSLDILWPINIFFFMIRFRVKVLFSKSTSLPYILRIYFEV